MITKWLVVWWVCTSVQTDCPDWKPDEYTGSLPNSGCLVLHTKTVYRPMLKEFQAKFSAQDFINKAPEYIRKRMKLVDVEAEKE